MAYTFNTELKSIAATYLELIAAKVTKTSIKTALEENSHYPSLLALSDVFLRYNIDSQAYKIEKKDFDDVVSELPFVAFAKLPVIGTDFVLVTAITADAVTYIHKEKKSIPKSEFLEGYQEVVWKAEPTQQSGQTDYKDKLKEEKTKVVAKNSLFLGGIVVFVLMMLANLDQVPFLSFLPIILLKTIGIATTILLLIFEIDKNNAFVKNICTVGAKTNCDAILNSKAAKILGLSWGEIGFYYFASTGLGLLLPTISFEAKATCLALVNACAVPYVFFSIYYQWKIAKEWCPLCLTVQLVLVLELLWSVIVVWQLPFYDVFQTSIALSILFCVLLPVLLWNALKDVLIKATNHDLYKPAYKRLQYNPAVFEQLLVKQDKIPDGWQDLGIDIGNEQAKHVIIKICNPYCKPCEESHSKLEAIIKQNNNTRLKIIYITHNNTYDKGVNIVKHLLSISSEENPVKTMSALDDWYLNVGKNYEIFSAKYPVDKETLETKGLKLNEMSDWCTKANVTHTPTVFLDGYRLPENYTVDDLSYIL